jgi:4-hydroxy-3-polyprenylbenzoate decarboxylase/2,5-furandicarboxylate decarboxylase 1
MEGPLGEYTGYYTPASLKPVGRIRRLRTGAIRSSRAVDRQAGHKDILKQIPFGASFLRALKHRFDGRGGVDAHLRGCVVLRRDCDDAALRRRSASGDLAAMASNILPKWTVIVIPTSTCTLPPRSMGAGLPYPAHQDTIIVGDIPSGPSDPPSTIPPSRAPRAPLPRLGSTRRSRWQAVLRGGRRAGLGNFEMPELD